MKKYTAFFFTFFVISATLFSCKKDENPSLPAEVKIKIVKTTSSSIEYSITSENSVKVYHACAKTENITDASYIESESDSIFFKAENLEENCEYTISAYAVNAEGLESEKVFETAVTTTLPSIKIDIVSLTDTSIVFKALPLNAVSFDWTAVPSNEVDGVIPDKHVESNQETEITIEGLTSDTHYTILALASNDTGEKSEIVSEEAITEATPTISIINTECDETSAVIEVKGENASKMYYALTKSNESQPSKENFTKFTKNILYFYELETGSEYTLWLYAENRKGYAGKITNHTFKAETGEDKGYKIAIKDITSFDATIDVSWNKDKYAGAYWVVDSPENIKDQSNFNWEEGISNYYVKKISYQGQFHIKTFNIKAGEMQRVGIIFTDTEGNIDESTSIWRDIQLDQINFDAADCNIKIEEISHSYSNIRYKIVNEGADSYYFGYDLKSKVPDINSFAIKVIQSAKRTDFNTEIRLQNLMEESEYVLVAVSSDKDGNLGKIISYEFTTDKIELKHNSKLEVSVSEIGFVNMIFDAKLGENTTQIVYVNSKVEQTEKEILRSLAFSYNKINKDGPVTISYLTNNTDFYTYFASVNEKGELGEMIKFENRTKKIEFTGTESVTISIDELSEGSMYNCTFTITPDENIASYYYSSQDKSTVEYSTDEQLAERLLYGGSMKNEAATITSQMFSPSYLVVVPINKNGQICEIIKKFIK